MPQSVFHPAFFFSTRLLLRFLEKIEVKNKTFLELGAGSGLIAFATAARGGIVTASDINRTAVDYLRKNSIANNIDINIIASDLFDNIPVQCFDIIAINPPYYKKDPVNDSDRAWFCGENSEYFYRLFETIGGYLHADSEIYMILCEACDVPLIKKIALGNNYQFKLVMSRKKVFEMNYIFKIERISA